MSGIKIELKKRNRNMNEFTKFESTKNGNSKGYELTKDQHTAAIGIIDFIGQPFDSNKVAVGLIGAGGVGKTFVTNYIINHCKFATSIIKCTSPTHKACRVLSSAIGGKQVDTIQSTFGLRLDLKLEDFNPTQPQFNPTAKPKLDNIKLLIIDEASMLNASLVTYIINLCRKLQIKVLFIGDSSQLAPVNERKSVAFDRCWQIYNLNEIVRQGKNNPINDLLTLLRKDIDKREYKFLEYIARKGESITVNEIGEGFTICNKNTFLEHINMSFNNPEYTKNIDMYRIIAYTNNCVAAWNKYIRDMIVRDADKKIITKHDLIMSYETIVNEFMETIINNSEEYIINDIVDYVDETYSFKGYLVKFQLIHGGSITKPLFIINHKDRYTVQRYTKVITDLVTIARNSVGGTRVSNWKKYYEFKKKYLLAANIVNTAGKILYARDIDYGFAITSHKSQGSTYDNVFVDLNDMVWDKNGNIYANQDDLLRRIYVACSRAKKHLVLCYG
jgi:exodeoxyribonuclease-5